EDGLRLGWDIAELEAGKASTTGEAGGFQELPGFGRSARQRCAWIIARNVGRQEVERRNALSFEQLPHDQVAIDGEIERFADIDVLEHRIRVAMIDAQLPVARFGPVH